MAISFVNKGTFASGTSTISPGLPASMASGDLCLMFIESANEAISITTAGSIAWTQVTNSPIYTGTAAQAGGVRLAVYYGWFSSGTTAPTIADSGDHTTGIIMAFRGVDATTPFDATPTTSVDASNTTTLTPTAITTATTNACVVYGIAIDADAATSDAIGGTLSNSNLSNITVRHEQTVTSGTGGGIGVITATKATAGATGSTTGGTTVSCTHAYLTMALRPIIDNRNATGPNCASGKAANQTNWIQETYVTDGNLTVDNYADTYPNTGAQHFDLDIGSSISLAKVKLWHYYGDVRTYYDVIIQISNDPTFATGVTTVYNNDTNNSSGMGIGTDSEYVETSSGLSVNFTPVTGRYLRFWSSGSTAGDWSHIVEIEVYPTIVISHSNTVSVTGEKGTSNRTGTFTITNSNATLATGLKAGKVATIPISDSNSMAASGKKGGKLATISISDSNSTSVISKKGGKLLFVLSSHSNSVSTTGKKIGKVIISITNNNSVLATNKKGGKVASVPISHFNSLAVVVKKAAKGASQITDSNSISVNGKKNGKNVSQITNSNSVSSTGKKAGKTLISITNTDSILVLGKKASKSYFGISHSNSITGIRVKGGRTEVTISYISTVNLIGKKKALTVITLETSSLTSSIGKKGAKSSAVINHSNAFNVVGAKTWENLHYSSFVITNNVLVGVAGRKSSRAPPVVISHISALSVKGIKIVRITLVSTHINFVLVTGAKKATRSVEINGAISITSIGRKEAKSTVSINNIQEVLITGRHTSKAYGAVTIINQNAITVIGKKIVKGTFSLTNSKAITASGRKGCNTTVILSGHNESVIFGMKASFVESALVNHSIILITGIRFSAHKPYEVILELIERRMDLVATELKRVLDIAIVERIATLEVKEEKPLDITLKERIAKLEVEEWHL
jgi:hypothetical protein